MKVLCFGEVLLDRIDGALHLGGAPVNFAVNSLNLGLEVDLYSAVGQDANGDLALDRIKGFGLDISYIQRLLNRATGIVDVEVNQGEPSYTIIEEAAYDSISSHVFKESLAGHEYDLLYFGTLAQRSDQSRLTLKEIWEGAQFRNVFFDCNLRQHFFSQEVLRKSLEMATIFKANEEELILIGKLLLNSKKGIEEVCNELSKRYQLSTMVITAGARGAYLFHLGDYQFIGSRPAALIDAVGAGDAFSAVFAANLIRAKDPAACVRKAHLLGGIVAGQRGAIPQINSNLKRDLLL